MQKLCISLIFIVGILSFCLASEESITITTYYPSPYGSYSSLQVDRFGVGDNNGDGLFTSLDVPTTTGDVWIKGKVGIGLSPVYKLDVNGIMRATSISLGGVEKSNWPGITLTGEYAARCEGDDCSCNDTGEYKTVSLGSHAFCFLTLTKGHISDDSDSGNNDSNSCRIYLSSGIWYLEADYEAGKSSCTGYQDCRARCID